MTLSDDYWGKRVIVSGCHSGMGEATARLLVRLGAEVHGLDWKDSALPLASFTRADLRDPASIDAAVEGIGGRIAGLFDEGIVAMGRNNQPSYRSADLPGQHARAGPEHQRRLIDVEIGARRTCCLA